MQLKHRSLTANYEIFKIFPNNQNPLITTTMEFLTDEKLLIVGAAGMIGSNMAQTAMMMKLTPNICLYDPYAPALEGVA